MKLKNYQVFTKLIPYRKARDRKILSSNFIKKIR